MITSAGWPPLEEGADIRLEVSAALEQLSRWMEDRDFAGPDPYDGLSSPVARIIGGRRKRQAWVQMHRWSPSGVRWVTGVRDQRMAKTIALYLSASKLTSQQPRMDLVQDLFEARTTGLWGYEFDVQTRWAFYEAGTPNVIVTSFVVDALRDLAVFQSQRGELLTEFREKFLAHPQPWIQYVPGAPTLIHNANALGALTLRSLGESPEAIRVALAPSLEAQRLDGSWAYGDKEDLLWVDNFHSAYILVALLRLGDVLPEVLVPLERGVRWWLGNMFDESGPLYYPNSQRRRGDIHNLATAVWALATIAPTFPEARSMLWSSVRALLNRQGRRGGYQTNRLMPPYMRWNAAHALLALASVAGDCDRQEPIAGEGQAL